MKKIIPLIKDIREIKTKGPWKTKSDGDLMIAFALSLKNDLQKFFKYDTREMKKIPDIRGLRCYTINNLSKNKIGGGEFHRLRQEIVFALEGSVRWECEDLHGQKIDIILNSQNGVWIPPFILHSYQVLEEGSKLVAIANTLFDHNDPQTHDTFSSSEFQKLQKISKIKKSK